MNPTKVITPMLALATIAVLTSSAALPSASAHSNTSVTIEDGAAAGKTIRIVLGHTNEPAYGVKPGISDGKHDFEVSLSDKATGLPLAGAELFVDKYYFKDAKSFEKAETVDDADAVQKEVSVEAVFGDPGHYVSRQLVNDGIYGYRLYGTIDYFGEGSVSVDSTIFCRSDHTETMRFDSPGWTGGFGCVEDINSIAFPEKNSEVKRSKAGMDYESKEMAMTTTTTGQDSSESLDSFATLGMLVGLPLIGIAAYLGWRSVRKSGKAK